MTPRQKEHLAGFWLIMRLALLLGGGLVALVVSCRQESNQIPIRFRPPAATNAVNQPPMPTARAETIAAVPTGPPRARTNFTIRNLEYVPHQVWYWEKRDHPFAGAWTFGGWSTNRSVVIPTPKPQEFFRFFKVPYGETLCIGTGKPQPPL